jgi:hypothetical protein
VCQIASTPTQDHRDSRTRCPHGYYRNARQLGTPRCRTCDPMAHSLEPQETSYALALLALKRTSKRVKSPNGQFAPEATVAPGMHRCWRCRGVFPATEEYFWRATTKLCAKKTGLQGCCKKCQNRRKTEKRRGDPRPGVQALLDVGVRL